MSINDSWANWNTLPETNISHLKMDGWNTNFLLGPGLFSGAKMLVSGNVVLWDVPLPRMPITTKIRHETFFFQDVDGASLLAVVSHAEACVWIQLSNEKTWLVRLYRGLYYPVI